MTLLQLPDVEALGREAALWVAELVRAGQCRTAALPTGRTPRSLYRALVGLVRAGELSLAHLDTFALDELCGLAPAHPLSFASALRRDLLSLSDQPPGAHVGLDGSDPDPEAACARFEARLHEVGGLDLCVLGLGRNGHLGMNEPGAPWDSRTRRVSLAPETVADLEDADRLTAAGFAGQGLTMGLGTILESRRILLLVSGATKRTVLGELLGRPASTDLPASCLHTHPDATVMVDAEARP